MTTIEKLNAAKELKNHMSVDVILKAMIADDIEDTGIGGLAMMLKTGREARTPMNVNALKVLYGDAASIIVDDMKNALPYSFSYPEAGIAVTVTRVEPDYRDDDVMRFHYTIKEA